MRYSFIFSGGKPFKMVDLINYIEKKYKLKYVEVYDFPSKVSFSIHGFGLNLGTNKLVIFQGKKDILIKCKNCNFPVEEEDLIQLSKVHKNCRNCETPIYVKEREGWCKI